MDLREFVTIIAALETGAAVGKDRLRAFYREAGRRSINLIRPGSFAQPVTAAAESVAPSLTRRALGTLARRSPYVVGGAVGYEALQRAPELIDEVIGQWEGAQETLGAVSGNHSFVLCIFESVSVLLYLYVCFVFCCCFFF